MLVLHRGAVTVSSTGAENQFQVDDNGHVGRPCEVTVSLAPPYPELFASYGAAASAVTRHGTSGRVAEVCVFITAGPFTKLCAWGRVKLVVLG